ncbi:hypothetical protein CON22_17965 [Bacillus cereus]|nr:hypothetical protein CON22_17965 [Bacillus cereus]
MHLEIVKFEIRRIVHRDLELTPIELQRPEFREKRYWDRYNTVNTFLYNRVIEKRKIYYPYRLFFRGFSDYEYFSGDLYFDLDKDYPKLINIIKDAYNQRRNSRY